MKSALLRKTAISLVAAAILAGCVTGGSQKLSSQRHPNLAQAQAFIQDAESKISAAQAANEFDMGGHAAKAKDLLGQAFVEIKLAAEAANSRY
jgi:hypothetical protein